jgi:hypothetical protein
VAQPLIVLGQFPVAGGGGLQPAEQGGVAAAVVGRHRRSGCPAAEVAQPLDLVADVGLGVEPGSGHPGCGGYRLEGHGSHPRRLATIDGARVWHLEDEIGTLTPGKQADIAVIDMRSPHLDGFGDPVAVMVLGAGPADVETVIVGGDVVKRNGKLAGDNAGHALELMHSARERLRA